MLFVFVGDQKDARRADIKKHTTTSDSALVYDDTVMQFDALEQFAYPALFYDTAPVIWVKFILGTTDTIQKEKIKILVESNTVFILEEFSISADIKKLFEKHGAQVFVQKKEAKGKAYNPLFSIVEKMLAKDKKERWLAYTQALREDIAGEALIGIVYWKIRQLLERAKGADSAYYKEIYRTYIHAHRDAWVHGYPLLLAIEKVLLA